MEKPEQSGFGIGSLLRLNDALRMRVQAAAPLWLLDNQMRVNSALGLLGFGATWMASGAGNPFVQTNYYRMATVPLGLAAMGMGIAFQEKRLSEDELAAVKARGLSEHIGQSLKDSLHPHRHVFQTNGLLGMAISGLLVASYKQEGNPAFWGELSTAAATGTAGASMLMMKDPAAAWQIRSGVYLASIPAELVANWTLWRSAADMSTQTKGKWLLAKTVLSGSAHLMSYFLGGARKEVQSGAVHEGVVDSGVKALHR